MVRRRGWHAARGVAPVEILICGIEIRGTVNQHLHPADGAMPHARRNENAGERMNIKTLAIKHDASVFFTFQNDIHLGVLAVVMLGCVLRDLRQVDRAGNLFAIGESTSSRPTRTRLRW